MSPTTVCSECLSAMHVVTESDVTNLHGEADTGFSLLPGQISHPILP